MDQETKKKIFQEVAGCMENLVGGSGHLTSYFLDRDTFDITAVKPLGHGMTEYTFTATATSQGEFMDDPQDPGDWESDYQGETEGDKSLHPDAEEEIAGGPSAMNERPMTDLGELLAPNVEPPDEKEVSANIVLNAKFKLTLDKDGNVRLGGYTCLSPIYWHPDYKRKQQ